MPLAMEGALKLKEISYIHAESYPGGELKHGPLALVDEKTPTVVLTGSGIRAAKIKSNMQEIVARRGPLLVFAEGRGDKEIERIADELIVLPHAKGAGQEMIMPIVYGVATQLLAYEVALRLGTDIDKPRKPGKVRDSGMNDHSAPGWGRSGITAGDPGNKKDNRNSK